MNQSSLRQRIVCERSKRHEELRSYLGLTALDQKRFADQHRKKGPELQPGDRVWLDARNIKVTRPCRKLDYKRLGPFRIRKKINEVAFELELPPWLRMHPVFHVSLLEKVILNQYSGRHQSTPPPAVQVDAQEEYLVDMILDSRITRKKLQYLVDWEGYPPPVRALLGGFQGRARTSQSPRIPPQVPLKT
jgi:hypothetical protein